MPSITFTVTEDAETSMTIKGIKGTACKPIHAAVSASLAGVLDETHAEDTAEMRDGAPLAARQQVAQSQRS